MYGDRSFGGNRFAPVKVDEELDVKIEAVGAKGDGIAKTKGFVLFIPGAKEGDEVRIKITKVLRNVGFAEVIGQAENVPSEDNEEAAPAEPAEDSTSDASNEEVAEETPQETEEEPAADPQDSEDFGEDVEEEKKEE